MKIAALIVLLFVTLAVSLATTQVDAGPNRLSVSLGSKHYPAADYEEFNPGLFLSWETNQRSITTGAFRNSYGDLSAAATIGWRVTQNITLFGGVAHYPDAGQYFKYHLDNLIPIAGIRVTYRNVFVQAIPGAAAFGLTWSIDK